MTGLVIVDVDKHIVKNQTMYFGTLGATANRIASDIAADALVLGSASVAVWFQDGWWLIAADFDWLNAKNRSGVTDQNAFETTWALPEAGQNFHWSTVMARVFAGATATRSGDSLYLVKGAPEDLQQFAGISMGAPHLNRVIGFKFQAAA